MRLSQGHLSKYSYGDETKTNNKYVYIYIYIYIYIYTYIRSYFGSSAYAFAPLNVDSQQVRMGHLPKRSLDELMQQLEEDDWDDSDSRYEGDSLMLWDKTDSDDGMLKVHLSRWRWWKGYVKDPYRGNWKRTDVDFFDSVSDLIDVLRKSKVF